MKERTRGIMTEDDARSSWSDCTAECGRARGSGKRSVWSHKHPRTSEEGTLTASWSPQWIVEVGDENQLCDQPLRGEFTQRKMALASSAPITISP